jgi:hypothetical protein
VVVERPAWFGLRMRREEIQVYGASNVAEVLGA